jgi:16S rRNA processing protein RimM
MKKDLFPIGRVLKPHGVKGKIKVEYFGEELSRFLTHQEVLIEDDKDELKPYEILEAIPQPPRLILRLKEIERIEEVQPLMGREIYVNRGAFPPLKKGEYYWIDILGMVVETEGGKRIGRIKEIFPTGANDVYVVEGKKREIFLPATEEVIQKVDLEKGVMKVIRMEGLWEDEDEV